MYRSAAGPLGGIRVLVTRPQEQAISLTDAIASAGGTAVLHPTVRIADPPSWAPFNRAFATEAVKLYTLAVFTSATAVRRTLERIDASQGRLHFPTGARLAAVGRRTAAILQAGGHPASDVAEDERQEGLAALLDTWPPGRERVIFPQAFDGRSYLRGELERHAIQLDVVPVYQTLAVEDLPTPPPFDAATFMSPSALSAFVGGPGSEVLGRKVVAVIGPTTAARAAELGVRVDVTAARPGAREVVDALISFYEGRPGASR